MKSDYIRRPITDAERVNLGFLDEWPIDGLLSMGGIVAGGAVVTAVFRGERLTNNYLRFREEIRGGGDIDFFFPTQQSQEAGLAFVNAKTEASTTDIKTAWTSWTQPRGYKLQIISRIFGSEPEDVMDKFDFANCKAAFDGSDLIYHKDLPELEATRTLRMDRSSGFILAWRFIRYMNKGYEKIHADTHAHIADWFLRVRFGEWSLDDSGIKGFRYTYQQLEKFISDPRVVRDEDLLLAVGYMRLITQESASSHSYNPVEPLTRDIAREELQKRLGCKELKLPSDWEQE